MNFNWGNNQQRLAVTIGVGLLSAAAAYKLYVKLRGNGVSIRKSDELVKSWKEVGRVTNLHIFPIKSFMVCKNRQLYIIMRTLLLFLIRVLK